MYSKEDQRSTSTIKEREVEETITTTDPIRGVGGEFEEDRDMIDERKPQRSARRREPTPPHVGKKMVKMIYFVCLFIILLE